MKDGRQKLLAWRSSGTKSSVETVDAL